jgi:hypothetical protein
MPSATSSIPGKAIYMTQKSSGGWSLRKALVRRIAQAVNEYEKEANRPEPGAAKSTPAKNPPADSVLTESSSTPAPAMPPGEAGGPEEPTDG